MTFLNDTWQIYKRHLRMTRRQPIWVIMSLIQPLIWLLLYSQLFQNMVLLPGFPTRSYLQFFAPGVVVMTALFGSAWSGMGILRDLDFGVIEKMLVTPVSRTAIMLGRVLHAATTASAQALIVLFVARLLGATIAGGFTAVIVVALAAGLLGAAFSSMANGMGVILKREEPLIALLNFVLLPLMFLSAAMMPTPFMPGWMAAVARFNPVNWCVDAVRTAVVEGARWGEVAADLAWMAAFAAVLLVFATSAFRARAE